MSLEHQSHGLERRRHTRVLGGGARRRHDDPHGARQQLLERFDAFARDLEVRLFRPQGLPLRVQHGGVADEGLPVGEPAFGVGGRRCDDDEHALRQPAGQGGE